MTRSDLSRVTVQRRESRRRIQSYRWRRKDPDPGVSADVNMNVESQEKDGVESEEDEGVNEDGFAVGLHASELQLLAVSREGTEQPWLKQHEQHHADEHWGPIRHFLFRSDQKFADLFSNSPLSQPHRLHFGVHVPLAKARGLASISKP
ncbi:uncharacterized protein LOC129305559 [Prosopis cineraria]|uniref:uncharacterized protein LOC129305559 n=1 Tax=Prosopis cineraria TaxID=364024 RepID=UPI00240FF7CD|nr:uncharacterized protein LOC129305559 [Prosopis cineraria]